MQSDICRSLSIIRLDTWRSFKYTPLAGIPLENSEIYLWFSRIVIKQSYSERRSKYFGDCLPFFSGFNHSFHKILTVSPIFNHLSICINICSIFFFSFYFVFGVTHLVLTNSSVLTSNIFGFILSGSSLESLIMQEKTCYFENHKHFTNT